MAKQPMERGSAGFTLTEILVVIGLIALMAAIIFPLLGNNRKKARDARRMADIKSLQEAIHLYIGQNNGAAPADLDALVPDYLAGVPADPTYGLVCDGSPCYGYMRLPGVGAFVLGARMDTPGQVPPLNTDWDGNLAITINGRGENCNDGGNGGMPTEVVYCIYDQ